MDMNVTMKIGKTYSTTINYKTKEKVVFGIVCYFNPPIFRSITIASTETFNTFDEAYRALINCIIAKNDALNKEGIIAATFFESKCRISIECEEKGIYIFEIYMLTKKR